MASIDRTAYPVYRRTPSFVELKRHYTLTAEEREWLRESTRRPAGLLCCAVLLKAVQHLGYFPMLSLVPESVIAHLRRALDLPETVSIFGVSSRSVKTYIQRIREHQGLISHGRTVRHLALLAMLQAAETSDAPVDLINVTLELLYKQRAEFPAFSTLDRLARRVRTLSQSRLAALLRSRLTEAEVARLLALPTPTPGRPFTLWNDLKRLPEPATFEHFSELLDHLTWVEQLGRFTPILDGVAPRKVQQLAAEARVLDAAEVRDLAEPRKLLLAVCLVYQAQAQTRDALVSMFIKRIGAFQRAARKKLEELQRTHQNAVDQLLATFQAVLEAHATATPEARDTQIAAILDGAGGPASLHDRCSEMRAFTGNNHLPLVWKEYRSHRSLCFRLVEALTLVSTSQDTSLLTALELIRAHQHQKPAYLPATLDLSFAPEAWQRLVVTRVGGERVLDRKQLEACVFVCLANELRSGDVAVDDTNNYPDTRAQMLPWAECAPLVAEWAAQMGLPPTASAFVADLRERLTAAAALVDQQFPEQDQLSISPDGVPVLKRIPQRDVPRSARVLERQLLARIPDRHLLDMVAAVRSWTNCTRHLGPPAGTEPKLDDANADYTRLLFAYGTNLGPTQAARHMREAVSARSLSYLRVFAVRPGKVKHTGSGREAVP